MQEINTLCFRIQEDKRALRITFREVELKIKKELVYDAHVKSSSECVMLPNNGFNMNGHRMLSKHMYSKSLLQRAAHILATRRTTLA